jgi:hypothetical protein
MRRLVPAMLHGVRSGNAGRVLAGLGHGGGGGGGGGHGGGGGGRGWGGRGWGGPWWGGGGYYDDTYCSPLYPCPGMTIPVAAVTVMPGAVYPANMATLNLAGLGDLGDTLLGANSIAPFKQFLITHIASKAGPTATNAATGTPSIAAAISYCATIQRSGIAGSLTAAQQAAWNTWAATAQDGDSDYNIYWMFGQMVSDGANDLIAAANAYQTNSWLDPAASECDYTFMDTTASGTTWYGGTQVVSLLTNAQWGVIMAKGFTCLQTAIRNGVLTLSYLQVFCQGLLAAPNDRRFPMFTPPGGITDPTDPRGIAFRSMMKQIGWNAIVDQWFSYTNQGWAAQNDALNAQDAALSAVVTALDYTSGDVILQQIQAAAQNYAAVRAQAVATISGFNALAASPAGPSMDPNAIASMSAIQANFVSVDNTAYTTLNAIGMWPGGTPGTLQGLGLATLIVAGVIAVTTLGIIAYIVDEMTAVSQAAAAQSTAVGQSVLATVNQIKDSCDAVFNASQKTDADNQTYQECLLSTQKMYAAIPPMPTSNDPLGLKNMAMLGAVGVVGVVVLAFIAKSFMKGRSISASAGSAKLAISVASPTPASAPAAAAAPASTNPGRSRRRR